MIVNAGSIRATLADRSEVCLQAHRNGAPGFSTCSALTAAVDDALQSAFAVIPQVLQDDVAVLALGGYGRAELCPKSDIDIMVLCESGKDGASETAKQFLHLLWDAGVNVGHSVRTVKDALSLHGHTLDAWASMLESRYLCGSKQLADSLFAEMRKKISTGTEEWLVEGILTETQRRHYRYGNSVKLLEPNVKNSAGGLRDFHAIFWLYRGLKAEYFSPLSSHPTASERFLDQLLSEGVIEKEIHSATILALQFLYRVRHEMHTRRGSLHDILEYALQRDVAAGLGYGDGSANGNNDAKEQAVEVFMRDYYLHARAVHRFHQRMSLQFKEVGEPHHDSGSIEFIGELFSLRGGLLSIKPGVQQLGEARQIFEAFVQAAENDADLDFRLRALIERSIPLITNEQRQATDLASLFRRILNSRRAAQTLRAMNDLGVLGQYVPEFGDLVAFFQHNVYHYFTADEHTLIALANAERLREEKGVMREVFRNLRRKDVLYLSILLHDIAKPRGVADHEITGVEMATTILERMGINDTVPLVTFLVRNHLLMEQIAFRRNIHDPETIKEFAARFENREQLDYLYLLTYADLSALNINVWTEWKSAMLQDLYLQTAEVLRRNLSGAQIDSFHQSRREAAAVDVVEQLSKSLPREKVESHLQGIQNAAYVSLFTEEEIREHIIKSENQEPVSTIFSHEEGYTEITIIARDAPFALSRFCAVLTANDANIFDANIFTRNDGLIIDRFRVSATSTRHHLEQRVCKKIADDLAQVVEGMLDINHLFETHHRKWKRVQRMPVNPNVRIDVEFEDNPAYTIIDVYASDSVGFLYRITEAISRLGLSIFFAKIATRGDGIVDAFYTLDRSGKPITNPDSREAIRSEILKTIRNLQEQELA